MLTKYDLIVLCQLPENGYWLCTTVFGLFALYFLSQWYKSMLKLRSVSDTPTSKIRSAAQGYVEIKGIQKRSPQSPIIGKLSKLPCTWYQYQIEYYHSNNKQWQVLETGKSYDFIYIEDGTGGCYVDPHGGDISTPTCDIWQGRHRYPSGYPKGFWAQFFSFGGKYRYTEKRMEEGMPLYVCGQFITLSQSQIESQHKTQVVTQMVHAWQKGNHPILSWFLPTKQQKETKEYKPSHTTLNIVSQYGLDNRHPFILSGHGEPVLLRRYRWDVVIWGAAFVADFALTLFLIHFRVMC